MPKNTYGRTLKLLKVPCNLILKNISLHSSNNPLLSRAWNSILIKCFQCMKYHRTLGNGWINTWYGLLSYRPWNEKIQEPECYFKILFIK